MSAEVSVSRYIAAPTSEVWRLVTDLPRMSEWSDENNGGRWLHGVTEPAEGATFRGANGAGFRRWRTKVTVDDFVPTTRFSFRSSSVGIPLAQWTYELEGTPEGCRTTESWTDLRPGFFKPISAFATGVRDRAAFTEQQMATTLQRLGRAAESTSA